MEFELKNFREDLCRKAPLLLLLLLLLLPLLLLLLLLLLHCFQKLLKPLRHLMSKLD